MTIIDREGNAHDVRGQFAGRENGAPTAPLRPERPRRTKRWLVAGGAAAVAGIITAGFLLGGSTDQAPNGSAEPAPTSSAAVITDDVGAHAELTSESVIAGLDLSSLAISPLSMSGESFTGDAVSARAITRQEAEEMGYRSQQTDGVAVLITYELLASDGSRSVMVEVPYLFQPDRDGTGESSGGAMDYTADVTSNKRAVYGSGDTRFVSDQFHGTTSVVAP